jgi:hypothetical protein
MRKSGIRNFISVLGCHSKLHTIAFRSEQLGTVKNATKPEVLEQKRNSRSADTQNLMISATRISTFRRHLHLKHGYVTMLVTTGAVGLEAGYNVTTIWKAL